MILPSVGVRSENTLEMRSSDEIALQLNVDYDVSDQSLQYQGRLVFEPYQG